MKNEINLLGELAKVKAMFQQRAVLFAIGENPDNFEECGICGDSHRKGEVPFTCATGDGV